MLSMTQSLGAFLTPPLISYPPSFANVSNGHVSALHHMG